MEIVPREDPDAWAVMLLAVKLGIGKVGKAGTAGKSESLTAKKEARVEHESIMNEVVVVVGTRCEVLISWIAFSEERVTSPLSPQESR